MSGRKQHYIPQFLLKAFGEKGPGKKTQVRVITSKRSFICPTDGIAAQRNFYSSQDNASTDDGLDDRITKAETEYSKIHQDLLDLPIHARPSTESVARLLAHLSARSKNLRDYMEAGGSYIMKGALELFSDLEAYTLLSGFGGSEPNKKLRDMLDNVYNTKREEGVKARI